MVYLIVSDFHLTDGPGSVTEDFHWDSEFRDFLRYRPSRGPVTLILNGDIFDPLQVLGLPSEGQTRGGVDKQVDITRNDRLRCTERASLYQVRRILAGHPVFVEALADFIGRGNSLVVIKGNHDVQLCWASVQRCFLQNILCRLPPAARKSAGKRVMFCPWVYYVPGLLLVEHGNQHEETCSYRNFLAPFLPASSKRRTEQIELDLASLLIRYVTNALESVDPLADNVRPLTAFYRMFFFRKPVLLLKTFSTALYFVLKAFGKAAESHLWRHGKLYQAVVKRNLRMVRYEARRFLGGKKRPKAAVLLEEWYAGLASPTLEQGSGRFLLWALRPVWSVMLWILVAAAALIVPWEPPVVRVIAAVLLFAAGLTWEIRVHWKRPSPLLPDVVEALRVRAREAVRALQVRFVVFGHSHTAEVVRFDKRSAYINTGTWMEVVSDLKGVPKVEHTMTFARVTPRGADLLVWDGKRSRPFAPRPFGPRPFGPRPVASPGGK